MQISPTYVWVTCPEVVQSFFVNLWKRDTGDFSSSLHPFSPSPFLLTFVNQLADFSQVLQRVGSYLSNSFHENRQVDVERPR